MFAESGYNFEGDKKTVLGERASEAERAVLLDGFENVEGMGQNACDTFELVTKLTQEKFDK